MSRLIRGACVASERKYPRAKMPAIMTPAITRTNKMERIGEPLSGNSAGALRHIIRQARRLVIRRLVYFLEAKSLLTWNTLLAKWLTVGSGSLLAARSSPSDSGAENTGVAVAADDSATAPWRGQ